MKYNNTKHYKNLKKKSTVELEKGYKDSTKPVSRLLEITE